MKQSKQPKLKREETISNTKIKLFEGDITQVGGGVMICPTDSYLTKLGGISSHILQTGGQSVFFDLSTRIREGADLNPGECIITTGGSLLVNRLIHICIPAYNKQDPEPQLRATINQLLNYLEVLQVNSVILPCLTKEVFGFTPDHCSFAYLTSIIDYVGGHQETNFKEFKIVCKDQKESKPFELQADRSFGKKEKKSFFSIFQRKKKMYKQSIGLELGGEERKG